MNSFRFAVPPPKPPVDRGQRKDRLIQHPDCARPRQRRSTCAERPWSVASRPKHVPNSPAGEVCGCAESYKAPRATCIGQRQSIPPFTPAALNGFAASRAPRPRRQRTEGHRREASLRSRRGESRLYDQTPLIEALVLVLVVLVESLPRIYRASPPCRASEYRPLPGMLARISPGDPHLRSAPHRSRRPTPRQASHTIAHAQPSRTPTGGYTP